MWFHDFQSAQALIVLPSSAPCRYLLDPSDPECCDGSDEYDGKVVCPNVCAKVGKEYRKKMAEIENTRRAVSLRNVALAD